MVGKHTLSEQKEENAVVAEQIGERRRHFGSLHLIPAVTQKMRECSAERMARQKLHDQLAFPFAPNFRLYEAVSGEAW